MKKKLIWMLVCLIVLGGLLAVYFIVKNQPTPEATEPMEETESYLLSDKTSGEIQSIEILSETEEMKFEIDDEGVWSFADDKNIAVTQSTLKSMASTVSYTSSSRIIAENADSDSLKEYGLNPPALTVRASFKNGSETLLKIGVQTPDQSNYYVMSGDDPAIYLLSSYSLRSFTYPKLEFVDITLTWPDITDLLYVRYVQKDQVPVLMVRNENLTASQLETNIAAGASSLMMKEPLADKNIYDNYFSEMFYNKISAVTLKSILALQADPAVDYGFDTPVYEAELLGENAQVHLIVGNDIDNKTAYCKLEGLPYIFSIDSSDVNELLAVKALAMVERFVSIYNIDTIEEFTITSKADGKTHVGRPNHGVIKAENEDEEDEAIMNPTMDDVKVAEKEFKLFYRIVIGIQYDSAQQEEIKISGEPDYIITYKFNNGNADVVDKYYEYNKNFYIVEHDGQITNIVSKKALNDMYLSIDKLLNGTLKEK